MCIIMHVHQQQPRQAESHGYQHWERISLLGKGVRCRWAAPSTVNGWLKGLLCCPGGSFCDFWSVFFSFKFGNEYIWQGDHHKNSGYKYAFTSYMYFLSLYKGVSMFRNKDEISARNRLSWHLVTNKNFAKRSIQSTHHKLAPSV